MHIMKIHSCVISFTALYVEKSMQIGIISYQSLAKQWWTRPDVDLINAAMIFQVCECGGCKYEVSRRDEAAATERCVCT